VAAPAAVPAAAPSAFDDAAAEADWHQQWWENLLVAGEPPLPPTDSPGKCCRMLSPALSE
jgi:hypothetical protein